MNEPAGSPQASTPQASPAQAGSQQAGNPQAGSRQPSNPPAGSRQPSNPPADSRQPSTHATPPRSNWPLYEVFLRSKRGLNHVHVGSLHAADATMALHHARDLYTRRNEGVSIWVVKAADITLSPLGAKNGSFSSGLDAVMSAALTTQMLTPSFRRV